MHFAREVLLKLKNMLTMYHTDSFWSKNTHGNLLSEKVCGNRELDILKCPISTFCSLFLEHSRDWHDKILATFPLLYVCVCVNC